MADLLVAEKVRKEFGGLVASNDIDFTIPQGSIVSLIGPNGAGKTTFFNMLTGVYKPTEGRIVFDGDRRQREAAARDHRARRRPHVPEHPALPADDRARQRARRDALPSRAASSADPRHAAGPRARSARRTKRARGAARRSRACAAGRTRSRETSRTATSAGSRSRARSRREPKLLLLDEPTAGMNPQETADSRLVRVLRDERG